MNSEEYGKHIVKKNFEDAIDSGVICDYTLAVPLTNSEPINVIRSAIKELALKHMLVYTNRCENARLLDDALNAVGINSYYLDGTHSKKERNRILREFQESGSSVLCSVRVLQEGISLPIVDSVYFVDSRGSEIDITQMIGRSLRLYTSKTLATIIIPSDMLKNKPLINTLVKMDPRIKKDGEFKMMGISGDPDNKVRLSRDNLTTIKRRVDFIRLNGRDGIWEWKCGLCLEFEGDVGENISATTVYNGINIGYWLGHVKENYKKGKLDEYKITQLLGLRTWRCWIEKIGNARIKLTWEEKLALCKQYERDTGENIKAIKFFNDVNIGAWLNSQKRKFNTDQLTDGKISSLNQLKTWRDWLAKDTNGKITWDDYYRLCQEYEADNMRVGWKALYKGEHLGNWIDYQKTRYKRGSLNERELDKLDHLNTWKEFLDKLALGSRETIWIKNYELCRQCENENGHIPRKMLYGGANIGDWFVHQKSRFKKNNLDEKFLVKLGKLNTWNEWVRKLSEEKNKLTWDDRLELCLNYEIECGHIKHRAVYHGENIGGWFSGLKRQYKKNTLSKENLEKLNRLTTWRTWLDKILEMQG